jgi:hypothetical protein
LIRAGFAWHFKHAAAERRDAIDRALGDGLGMVERLSPKTRPPRSRIDVKPRISMSLAAFTAATLTKPMSPVNTCACGRVENMTCVCASIRPGFSLRPPPAMRVTAESAIFPSVMMTMLLRGTEVSHLADFANGVGSKRPPLSRLRLGLRYLTSHWRASSLDLRNSP